MMMVMIMVIIIMIMMKMMMMIMMMVVVVVGDSGARIDIVLTIYLASTGIFQHQIYHLVSLHHLTNNKKSFKKFQIFFSLRSEITVNS